MPDLVPIRYDQAGLRGQVATLLTELPTDDAGVPVDLPKGTKHVVIVDDTPNPTLTLRVHPVGDDQTIVYVDHAELALGESDEAARWAAAGGGRSTDVSGPQAPASADDVLLAAEAARFIGPIVQALGVLGPPSWEQFNALFAIAGSAEIAQLEFFQREGVVQVPVPVEIMSLVREHRAAAARMSSGPWWLMRLSVDRNGQVSEQFDYGEEPFPRDQLFTPEDYRADIEAMPRPRVPVWLAGYIAGAQAQGRSPGQALAESHADLEAAISATATSDIVALSEVWYRWAVVAAIRAGLHRSTGAWIEPAVASFENGEGSGATLCVLPRDRAVLSGGLWNSPLLDAAYNGGGSLPALFAGAPDWVNDTVLNSRCQRGALSFCYWWDGGQWWRGAVNTFDELDGPLPAIWTDEEAINAIVREVGEGLRDQVAGLVAAAAQRAVSRADLVAVLSAAGADIGAANNQLSLAGLSL
ncbi:hypothetical protein [Mycolicibacterium sp.]